MVRARKKAKLIGVGLDKKEEDVLRVTKGENYQLVGGSEETHETMQEKCVKFNEKLKARGKELEDLEQEEFLDLAGQVQMNVLDVRKMLEAKRREEGR